MSTSDKPTVLIVGAGLGGLLLGALFEKSDVPYMIFERATTVKPLGSAMAVGPNLLPILEQLGIYDEFLTIGKYLTSMTGYKESLAPLKVLDLTPSEEFTGYGQYIVARPKLYDLILKQVPAHKIHFGHRVLNITEEDGTVTVHLSNNDTIKGDIIVGADGAYSAVRQRMYEQMMAEGKLPKSDQEELPFSCTCLVGQTNVLDPKEFPIVAEAQCQFSNLYGDNKPFTWHTFNTAQGTLCWMVLNHLSKKTSKAAMAQRFRNSENSEWGEYPAKAMCEETRDFPIELLDGKKRTLGDLYDQTPKEYISKVMLEEKVFMTWHYKRFVLLGDACHKLYPAGGHGAVTAMHDAIALANLFYAMPAKTSEDITKIFEEYQKERLPAVIESYNTSKQLSKIAGRDLVGAFMLYLSVYMPFWLWKLVMARQVRCRPQVGFIKAVDNKGTVVPAVSKSEQMARTVFESQRQQTQTAAASI